PPQPKARRSSDRSLPPSSDHHLSQPSPSASSLLLPPLVPQRILPSPRRPLQPVLLSPRRQPVPQPAPPLPPPARVPVPFPQPEPPAWSSQTHSIAPSVERKHPTRQE